VKDEIHLSRSAVVLAVEMHLKSLSLIDDNKFVINVEETGSGFVADIGTEND
jgi:hypothetical protein